MSNARNLARVVADTSGAIAATNLANAVPADGSITTAKLAANAVTDAKIAGVSASKLSGALAKANMASGTILQVVNFQENGRYSYSGDWHNTAITAQITPISASSRIFLFIHLGRVGHYAQNSLTFRIARNGSLAGVGAPYGSRQRISSSLMRITTDGNHAHGSASLSFVDSPATTSAVTYILQANQEGNAEWFLNRNGSNTDSDNQYNSTGQSNITLMEIAG